jgi:hypothetical protein
MRLKYTVSQVPKQKIMWQFYQKLEGLVLQLNNFFLFRSSVLNRFVSTKSRVFSKTLFSQGSSGDQVGVKLSFAVMSGIKTFCDRE